MNTDQTSRFSLGLGAVLVVLFCLSLAFFIYGNNQAGMEIWQLVVSALLLAVPLVLMYLSFGVLITAWHQKRMNMPISRRLAKFIYLTPRIAGILIVVFVSLFALDMFGEGTPFWQAVLGFIIHAAPALVMGALLVLAWRWSWVGFVIFLAGALFFMRFVIGRDGYAFGNLLLFVLPMLAIALLFGAGWIWRDEIRPSSAAQISAQ